MKDLLPESIQTPRLMLRQWKHDEAEKLSSAITQSVDHLRPWMGWIKFEPLTTAERVTLIERWIRDWEDGGDAVFGVFHDGVAVGGAGLHHRLGPGALEIGYWVHVDHIRQGYASELAAALTSAAFEAAGIERVEIHNDQANEASGGVPEKLGFRHDRVDSREPQAPAETGQLVIWTMAKQAWELRCH